MKKSTGLLKLTAAATAAGFICLGAAFESADAAKGGSSAVSAAARGASSAAARSSSAASRSMSARGISQSASKSYRLSPGSRALGKSVYTYSPALRGGNMAASPLTSRYHVGSPPSVMPSYWYWYYYWVLTSSSQGARDARLRLENASADTREKLTSEMPPAFTTACVMINLMQKPGNTLTTMDTHELTARIEKVRDTFKPDSPPQDEMNRAIWQQGKACAAAALPPELQLP